MNENKTNGADTSVNNINLIGSKKRITLNVLSLFKNNDAGRVSKLSWTVNNGYPRLIVFINGADRTVSMHDNTIIAKFKFDSMSTIINALKKIPDSKPGTVFEIKSFDSVFEDNKRTDETVLLSTIFIGKDNDGINFIGFKAEGKPSVKFDLLLNEKFHKILVNGTDITRTEDGSNGYTANYAKMVETAFHDLAIKFSDVKDIEPYGAQ